MGIAKDPINDPLVAAIRATNPAPATSTPAPSAPAAVNLEQTPVIPTNNGSAASSPRTDNERRTEREAYGLIHALNGATDAIVRSGVPVEAQRELLDVLTEKLIDPKTPVEVAEYEAFLRLLITSPAISKLFNRESSNELSVGSTNLTREGLQKLGAVFFFALLIRHDPVLANDLIMHQDQGTRVGVDNADIRSKFVLVLKELAEVKDSAFRVLLDREFADRNGAGPTALLAGILCPLFYINHRVDHPKEKGLLKFLRGKKDRVDNRFKDLGVVEPMITEDIKLLEEIQAQPVVRARPRPVPSSTAAAASEPSPVPASARPTTVPLAVQPAVKPAPTSVFDDLVSPPAPRNSVSATAPLFGPVSTGLVEPREPAKPLFGDTREAQSAAGTKVNSAPQTPPSPSRGSSMSTPPLFEPSSPSPSATSTNIAAAPLFQDTPDPSLQAVKPTTAADQSSPQEIRSSTKPLFDTPAAPPTQPTKKLFD